MSRKRLLTAAPVALVAGLLTAAVALGAAGDSDTTYGSKGIAQIPTGNGGTSSAAASVMQAGKLVIAGQATIATDAGPRGEIAITRLNPDGSRDTTFGTNGETEIAAGTGESEALAIAVTSDGHLVVAGSAEDSGTTKVAVARLQANGVVDPTFGAGGLKLFARGNPGLSSIGRGLAVNPDGSIVVASTVVDAGVNKASLDALSPAGTFLWQAPLTAAGNGSDTRATSLTRLSDGTLVLGGQAQDDAGTQLLLARFSAGGALTAGWGTQNNGTSLIDVGDGGNVDENAIAAGGSRIVAAGSATDTNEQKAFVAAFSASTGQPDAGFGSGGVSLAEIGTGGSSRATGVAIDAGGNVVIGGDASTDNQGSLQSQVLAARFLPNGALDPSFATAGPQPGASLVSGLGYPVHGSAVSLQGDGKILVAGRVGDGQDETMSAARYCSSGDQSCTGTTGATPPPNTASGSPIPTEVPRAPFECGKTVAFGLIEAQGCLQESGGKFIASGNVDVNGIIMRPEAGATIVLDPKGLRLSVQGPGGKVGTLSARVGTITLFENLPFDITLPSASLESLSIPDLKVSSRGSLFGFPLTGNADVSLTRGGVNLNVLVGLPSIFGGVTGAVTLRADLQDGLHLDGLAITAKDALIGPLEVKDLAISYSDSQKLWSGQATVFLQPFPYGASAALAVQNGSLKTLSAGVDGLNLPIGEVAFLQRISFGVSTNPLTFMGGVGISAGPEVAGVSAVRVDGNFKLSFPGKPLAKFEIQSGAFCAVEACAVGAQETTSDGLKVVGLPLGGFNFSADTDGNIAFGGHLGIDLKLVSLSASVSGWLDGVKAFNLEGSGQACVFSIACAGIDAVVSTEGLAACGYVHLLTVKVSVGFGIHWPTDVSIMGPACDIGPYRATHAGAARAAAARLGGSRLQAEPPTPTSITFPAGKDYSLVRLTGDTAPPMVTFSGERGAAAIDTPAAPSPGIKTDRFMIFKDYDKKQTIIVVTKPGRGQWIIAQDAGSAAITNIEQADPLPPVSVKAKVGGSGYHRTLSYDIAPIPGQSVTFAEVGGGVTRQLGKATKAHGSISFTPGDGNKGKRKIVATVIENGLPRKQLTAATYIAPARRLPSKIKTVTAKRTKTALNVRWTSAPNADTYRVMVSVSDGRVLMFNVPGKTRTLAVPGLLPAESAKVSVRGVTKQLRTGPATSASLKAVPVKKPTKKPAKTTKKK